MVSRIMLCVFCVVLISKTVPAQMLSSQPDYKAFANKQQQFVNYDKDFLDFAASGEFQPSYDLALEAKSGIDTAAEARVLLEIYYKLSCSQDRTTVRAVIRDEFDFYAKNLELEIKQVNLSVTQTEKTAIVSEAIRMRDDLRELQELLTSAKLP
jgi:hypothetical protein